ncbi:MAG: DMT family transporter [Hyphomicrobiales bacterium]|nr:DMT family transporter [Hyphomicrobiales bacterium]MCP5373350.1 DMT family transporter [Hyphomicrobiales bacterium]
MAASPTAQGGPNSLLIGVLSGLTVVAVWSGFIVLSRAGVTGGLTPYDLTALRFGVVGAVMIPTTLAWWPRNLSLAKALLLGATGPGVIYSLFAYSGLERAPAAYAGVFSNGMLPIFTATFAYFLVGHRLGPRGMFGIVVILAGCALLGLFDVEHVGDRALSGALLLLCSAAVLSAYMVGVRMWSLAPRQALAVISLPNAIVFLPLWYFFLPSTMAQADMGDIVLQGLFQGLGPSFAAVIAFALAIRNLGPTPTAGISALVPAAATLLAIPVLGEWPSPVQWAGVAVVSVGLALLLWRRA